MKQDVIRFEVAMHNIVSGEYFEGLNHLFEVWYGFSFWHDFLWGIPVSLKELLESTSVAVLVNEVEVVYSFEHVNVADDVLVVLYFWQGIDLINGALFQFGHVLKFLGLYDFHSNLFLRLEVDSLENLSIYALAQQLL